MVYYNQNWSTIIISSNCGAKIDKDSINTAKSGLYVINTQQTFLLK